jgi:hypothetical protein
MNDLVLDYDQEQQRDDRECERRKLEVLERLRVSIQISDIFAGPGDDAADRSDLDFLAAELGVLTEFNRRK